MAGCLPCFIIPLLLFIFHRYIQPIILKFWNPWEKKIDEKELKKQFNCTSCNYSTAAESCAISEEDKENINPELKKYR